MNRKNNITYDIIGDVHGCLHELNTLLYKLGYYTQAYNGSENLGLCIGFPLPENHKIVFIGDLADRGPYNLGVIRTVRKLMDLDIAIWVPGNHDYKLARYFKTGKSRISHGLQMTIDELIKENDKELIDWIVEYVHSTDYYRILDNGRLIAVHAAWHPDFLGRIDSEARSYFLYGPHYKNGDRISWWETYRYDPFVVYGHYSKNDFNILPNSACVDTSCVFGGHLSAIRYIDRDNIQKVSVKSKYTYYKHMYAEEVGLPTKVDYER